MMAQFQSFCLLSINMDSIDRGERSCGPMVPPNRVFVVTAALV